MIQRVAVGVILFVMLGAFSSPINTFIKNLRTDPVVVVEEIVTAPAETSGEVNLARELFAYNLINVTSVESSILDDSPIAASYDENTGDLTISGLDDDNTRDITVNYLAPMDDDFWNALGPFLGFLVYGGITVAIFYMMFEPMIRRKLSGR